MKKIIVTILSVLLALPIISSCEDEIIVTTGDIIGNVSDRTTGEPIPTANVKLEPSGNSVVTGRDGNYHFPKVEAGAYTISIEKEGYEPVSRNVKVMPGQNSEVNFTIERIPAVVTADRDVLDFGDGSDVNTLAFNIVNAGYEDLEWTIEYDCPWIKQIKDDSGVLKHGKTQTIVVFIDREKLTPGENKTIVVVKSSNGSSELKVTAIGEEKRGVSLNTLDVKDIAGRTAVFHGEIIDNGYPKYTERGFVYSHGNTPTKETSIEVLTAKMTDEKTFSVNVKNLELNTKYYVRAYAESPLGIFYSSNTVQFSTSGQNPVVKVLEVSDIDLDRKTAVLNGKIEFQGEPPYTEKGFVYADKNNPTIYDDVVISKGEGEGEFSERASGLELGVKYYVRAYVKWNDKIWYSESSATFTTESTKAEVSVSDVTGIDLTTLTATFNGSIDNPGTPEYTERGFVYGNSHGPTVNDTKIIVEGKGKGEYSANVEGLALNEKYYVKAYAINDAGIAYSHDEVSFETIGNSDLELSAAQLDFGTDKSEMALEIKNIGNMGDISWEVASISESWLQVLPSSGNLGMDRSAALTVLVDRNSITRSQQTAFTIKAAGKEYVVTVKVSYKSTGGGEGGGDTPEGTITAEDSRITGELVSVKRNGTTVTVEYTLRHTDIGDFQDFVIYTCKGSNYNYTKIYDEEFNNYETNNFTFNGAAPGYYKEAIGTRFPELVKASGKIVITDFAETSEILNIEMEIGRGSNDPELYGHHIYFKDLYVENATDGEYDETDGKDYSSAKIEVGDDRIEPKILSVKRNGTTVTFEYRLKNNGIGDMENFIIYTCTGSNYDYTKIYDEEFNSYETDEFTFHDEKPGYYNDAIGARFSDKVKTKGKIIIRDFAETSDKLNIEMRIGRGSYDPELYENYIHFKDVPVEGGIEGEYEETDGKDYSSAEISTGDDRIETKILSCKRNGTTVTLEYRLRNNGIGDMENFGIYTCKGSGENFTKIYDEDYNPYETNDFTFHDEKPGYYNDMLSSRFPNKLRTKGKIVITNVSESSKKLNIEIKISRGSYDPELNGDYINLKNVPIY